MRYTSAVILAIFVICLLVFGSPTLISGIIVCLSMLALHEFFDLTLNKVFVFRKIIGILLGGGLTATLIFLPDSFLPAFTLVLLVSFLIHLKGGPDFYKRLHALTLFYLGIMYICLLMAYWGKILDLNHWIFWLVMMIVCTFLSDTGAYFTGHLLGKHKLAPLISPGKTIEGYLGGIFFAVLGGFVVRYFLGEGYSLLKTVGLSFSIAAFAPLGDLSESLIKRAVNAKDSGILIPGHGGLLDRIDALLFAGPIVYYWAIYFH